MKENPSKKSPGPVVVGVDGSADGERALRFAVTEALRNHCGIRLVHVPHEVVPLAPMLPLFSIATLDDIGWQVLDEAASLVKEVSDGGLSAQSVLVHAPRVTGILDHAADARCVVLGPRSPALHRVVTGSTTTGVAARASCPVICVPRTESVTRHDRVVVGIDGSPPSSVVLGAAFVAAQERQAALEVLHAWRPAGLYDAAIGGRALSHDWEEQAKRELSELAAGWCTEFPDVAVDVTLRYERSALALVQAADCADLLVIGRHGHGGPLGFALGSTARALIRTAGCPVQILPVTS